MRIMYPLRLHPEKVGFWAEFPDLPGCYTQGDTEEETLLMAKDALTGWLVVRFERNFKIPEPSRLKGKRIRWVEPEPEVAIPLLIRKIRQEKGMSQKVVAKRLGITYQTYQKWEKPEAANPTIKQLAKVASAIGRELVVEMM